MKIELEIKDGSLTCSSGDCKIRHQQQADGLFVMVSKGLESVDPKISLIGMSRSMQPIDGVGPVKQV